MDGRLANPRVRAEEALALNAGLPCFELSLVPIAINPGDPVPRPFDRLRLKGNVRKESSSATEMLSKRLQ
jgi:hypothetical protein